MLLYAFLPLTLLFLTTSGISLALSRARKRRGLLLAERRTAGRAPRAMREATRSERALTLMMLAASILMMVLMLPVCLYYIIDHHTNLSDDENIRPELWRQIVHVMADSTHALNFYLYFVSVASFRRKFVTLVTCRKPRRRPFRSREEQNSSSTPVTTHVTLNHVENVQGDDIS
nr:hypothetical protein BaRGS_009860 [Batillaria attramentaria]